jgi:hypothetical protein
MLMLMQVRTVGVVGYLALDPEFRTETFLGVQMH